MYSARTAELASAEPVSGRRRPPAMLGASIVVALGIVAASAYGLLAPDPYRSLPDATVLAARGQDVGSLLVAALLVALARPHLSNPYFTLQASAWYQHLPQHWPPQYLSGRDQAFRNAARERAETKDLRIKARPASHEVVEVGVKRAA